MAETTGNSEWKALTIKDQMTMPFVALLASVPKRLLALVSKLISFKGAVIVLATVLYMRTDRFETWLWVTLIGAIVLGRDFMGMLKR